MSVWLRLLVFAWCLFPSEALARVTRYAILVGNNRGAKDEAELKYAETEASKLHEVLRDVGSFAAINTVVLRGESPETFEATLLTFNERIRASVQSGDETMLFVYFSGHADAEALHMNGGQFPIQKLEQLVRGSSATLRLLTIDACRSGSITRRKGGKQVAPFALRVDDRLAGQGVVFLTSAAANEDAQESDALGGSFFTHALTSGLLGAADANGDGLVVLDEAYRYAYEST
ncbi:MAG: caspase family protein, partial [Polyangiaceae bacterium]|nr:caspase family protein [Polyangiaceae bacterium]